MQNFFNLNNKKYYRRTYKKKQTKIMKLKLILFIIFCLKLHNIFILLVLC